MKKWMLMSLLAGAALLAGGCLELEQAFVLNPDGSGKVVIDMISQPMNLSNEKPDAKAEALKNAQNTITKAQGVDAWSDVSFEAMEDGRSRFKGTAYFSDFSKFRTANRENKTTWSRNDKGGMTLEMKTDEPGDGEEAKPMTDDEVKAKVKAKREEYARSKPMMAAVLGSLKIQETYRLPGKIEEVNLFQKTDGGVKIAIDGAKVIEVLDKIHADDKLMEDAVRSGGKKFPDSAMEMLYGGKGKAFARVGGDLKPQFDYKAEMEKAKAGQAEMLKKQGLEGNEGGGGSDK